MTVKKKKVSSATNFEFVLFLTKHIFYLYMWCGESDSLLQLDSNIEITAFTILSPLSVISTKNYDLTTTMNVLMKTQIPLTLHSNLHLITYYHVVKAPDRSCCQPSSWNYQNRKEHNIKLNPLCMHWSYSPFAGHMISQRGSNSNTCNMKNLIYRTLPSHKQTSACTFCSTSHPLHSCLEYKFEMSL